MKITRAEAPRPNPKPTSRRAIWTRWYAQAFLLLAAFALGMFVYRSGVIRPAYQFVQSLIRGEQSIPVPAAVQEVGKNISDEVRMYENNGLDTLYIDLPFKNYQKLLEKRNEALDIGILNTTDEDFVKGTVKLKDGPALDVKMRLKGDWTDHLEGDKWSFRIHLKEDGHILHATQFSIQGPETRNYLYEWAFHRHLMDEGLLTTRYDFINVLLNGKLLGIYAFEENFAPELIESQARRQGVIIRFDEDLMWQNMTRFWSEGFNQEGALSVTTQDSADITTFQESKVAENPVLAAEAAAAQDMLRAWQTGQRPATETFDVPLLGRFFALHDLWDACHGVAWHNLRFYYNPVTALLEPVAYDSEPFVWCSTTKSIITEFTKNKLFSDPAVRTAYANELARLTQAETVARLKTRLGAGHDLIAKALKVEFPDADVGVDWQALVKRAANLRLELQPAATVRGNYQLLPAGADGAAPQLVVDVFNLMLLPVDALSVELNGQVYTLDAPVQLLPVTDPIADAFQPVRIQVALPAGTALDAEVNTVKVSTRVTGLARAFSAELSGSRMPENLVLGPAPRLPTSAQALAAHPFLSADPHNPLALRVAQGIWNVTGDLVLPEKAELFIPAGTVLRFAPGSVLYASGPVHLLGTLTSPVLLTAQEETWGGMVVLKTDKRSTWQYAAVEKTGGIDRDGWTMTGGITFFHADILLDHVQLGNNQTEDAINVIHGNFEFRDSRFANTFADAYDSDFSDGIITGCLFEDITGDALDFSGSKVVISNTRMNRITDKGISVGEQSTAEIVNVQMDTVSIGVASKDLSVTTIRDSQIRAARFSALAAYTKKPVYGPASITTTNLTILDTQTPGVAQKGSSILINGEAVDTVDLDVDRLYQEGILGN